MKPRHKRLAIAGGVVAAVGAAAALVLNAFQSNLVFFYSPSQIAAHEAPTARTFRLGGMVVEGTVKRDGTKVSFVVTDTAQSIPVRYEGILPDLSGKESVVAQGQLQDGVLSPARRSPSTTRTTPPEAAEALKRAQKATLGSPRRSRSSRSESEPMIPELGHFLLDRARRLAVLGTCRRRRREESGDWMALARRRPRSHSRSSPSPSSASCRLRRPLLGSYVATVSTARCRRTTACRGLGRHEGSMWTLMLAVGRWRWPAQRPPAGQGDGAHLGTGWLSFGFLLLSTRTCSTGRCPLLTAAT
jgi:cytochrome c-type biogenesis protein CcmE